MHNKLHHLIHFFSRLHLLSYLSVWNYSPAGMHAIHGVQNTNLHVSCQHETGQSTKGNQAYIATCFVPRAKMMQVVLRGL